MTTGDLKNNLRKLHSELKLVNYSGELDIEGLSFGKPSAFLPLLHFVLTEFSLELAQYFYSKNYELLGKNDMKFIQVVYRILRDEFEAKATLTKEQFFTLGFAERKLQFVTLVLQLCRKKSETLKPKIRKTLSGLKKPALAKSCKSDEPVISKKVTMDTISRTYPQPSTINSGKLPKDYLALGGVPLANSVTVMDNTRSLPVSAEAIPRRIPNMLYVSKNLKNFVCKNPSPHVSSQDRCSPMDISGLSHFECKENVPRNNDVKSSLLEQQTAGHDSMFSPRPLTKTRVDQEFVFEHGNHFPRKAVSLRNGTENSLCSKHIYFNQESGGSDFPHDDEGLIQCLEKLSTNQESAVIFKYFKMQQDQIKQLQKDVTESAVHVQTLAHKNSELSARVMVLETAVTLLQEKID